MIGTNIKKYFTYVGDGKFVTTTKDKEYLCLHTTRPRRPLSKRLTNYVIEYEKD